jgi:undecaprenyl-diphosphatase
MFGLNQYFFNLIFQFAKRNFVLDDAGVFFAQYLPYLLILGFLVFALGKRDWRIKFIVIAEGILAVILSRGIITEIFRFFYHYPRPFDALGFTPLVNESSYSFPSGHAAFFFALAMVAVYYSRKLGTWYFTFAVLNGLARIYVGVHWPLDILGGVLVGVLSGIVVHALFRPTIERIKNPREA